MTNPVVTLRDYRRRILSSPQELWRVMFRASAAQDDPVAQANFLNVVVSLNRFADGASIHDARDLQIALNDLIGDDYRRNPNV